MDTKSPGGDRFGSDWRPCSFGGRFRPTHLGLPARWAGLQGARHRTQVVVIIPETDDFQQVTDSWIQIGHPQHAPIRPHLVVQVDQHSNGGSGKILNVRKVQNELSSSAIFHEDAKTLADSSNSFFGEELLRREFDDGSVTNIFPFKGLMVRL
ncbi:MAG TPA: hypothetical protein VKE98_21745 [Gemmataceae bacterium]|nr:hypothetical protein [Gemmataceae bacterium]